jgi:Response regulator of the LytR/AlgR family
MNQLKDLTAQESVIFNLFHTNSTINKVIDMLRQSNSTILATELQTTVQHKVKFSDVLYLDYVDRNVCLYTKNATYWVKNSFIRILTQLPSHFIQISKNNAVNIYEVKSVETNIGGNLIIKLSTDEKLVVSRRYIKNFKAFLIDQA